MGANKGTSDRKGTVSILGCGWLGQPLAKELIELGYPVKGSKRKESELHGLEERGIEAFQVNVDLESPALPDSFFHCKTLLIDIPPGRKDPGGSEAYPERVRSILEKALDHGVEKVLFVSSTSVHPETNDRIPSGAEGRSESGNGPVLRKAEELVRERFGERATIVRFGGLIGPGRHPIRYLSGRKSSRSGDAAVNMIHRDDAVGALLQAIEQELWGYNFDICAPEHPSRKAFYEHAAKELDVPAPVFDEEATLSYKIVDPSFFIEKSDYEFRYSDPLTMPVDPIVLDE